jgi:hypothetical protein
LSVTGSNAADTIPIATPVQFNRLYATNASFMVMTILAAAVVLAVALNTAHWLSRRHAFWYWPTGWLVIVAYVLSAAAVVLAILLLAGVVTPTALFAACTADCVIGALYSMRHRNRLAGTARTTVVA